MTISTQTARAQYAGNGVTTSFAVPFEFLTATPPKVVYTDAAGVDVTWVLTTNYTLTGGGAQQPATGSVVALVAPAVGTKITLLRNEALTQAADYIPNDPFPAVAHEKALDRLSMQNQMIAERVSRSIGFKESSASADIRIVDEPAAGMILGYNSAGTAIVNKTAVSVGVGGAAGAAIFAADTAAEVLDYLDLDNVDNTSDADKPVSTATQTALNAKVAGPASSTDGHIAIFDGTTGKLLKDAQALMTNINYNGFPLNGGVVRAAVDKLSELLSVKDFGAVGDDATNDTAAINTAIAAASALGMAVYFPAGIYRVTSLTTIPANIRLYGFDEHLTTIKTTSATADVVPVAAGNVKIMGIGFDSSVTRTAGRFVRVVSGASDFMLANFRMQNPFIGWSIEEGTAIIKVRDGYITGVAVNGNGGKIGESTGTGAFAVEITSVVINTTNAAGSVALNIVNAADVILTNLQLLDAPRNLRLAPGTGQSITSLKMVSGYVDTSTEISMAFSPSGTGVIQKVDFTGVWFQGGATNVILIDGGTGSAVIDGVTFSNCEAYNSTTGAGLSVVGRARNVAWLGGKIAACVYGAYLSTSSGFDNNVVMDARIGPIAPYAGNTTGIRIENSGDYIHIAGNDLSGNTTALTNNNTSTHNRIHDNIGYNDSPTMTGITVGASPFTMPTFPFPTVAYINAGTVSLISVNGAGILQSSNHAIYRPPNSTMIVTYSVLPTIVSVAA